MNLIKEVLANQARWDVVHSNNLSFLRALPDNSVDSIVTDPPAGISFMGRWDDYSGGEHPPRRLFMDFIEERFREVYRVLKPGGHGVSWGLPRTAHWTTMAIEDAGFEIRDSIHHLFAGSMAKGLNVSKAMDKMHGAKRPILGNNPNHRPISGVNYHGVYAGGNTGAKHITGPATEDAKKWDGYGTGLKPSHEAWILFRKPISEPTIVKNILRWGTGAINIDACRIPTEKKLTRKLGKTTVSASGWKSINRAEIAGKDGGMYPPNLILSHSEDCEENDCVEGCPVPDLGEKAEYFPCFRYVKKASQKEKHAGCENLYWSINEHKDSGYDQISKEEWEQLGGGKAKGNIHNTVKSVELMSWLTKMVTPKDGLCVDIFSGSGSTGIACIQNGFRFLGVDCEEDYVTIAKSRLLHASDV